MSNKSLMQKMMPHNREAEQSVLGCVLIDENASINILGQLKDDDFYLEAHKIIFDCMFTVYRNSMPVDFITLTDELEKRNMVDSVGGVEYIAFLTNFVPSASNYSYYSDIVKRNSVLRKLIHASNSIAEFAYTSPTKEEAVGFAEKAIFDISQEQDKSTLIHISGALNEVVDKFEVIQKDRGSLRGLPTGFYGLDKITNGLQRSDLILLAARPGFGKTSLAMNIATNTAINENAKVAMFSLEMPKVQLAQRALCSVAHVGMSKAMKGDLSMDEWSALWAAHAKLSKSQIYIDDSSLNTPIEILSKCRRLKAEHGLDLIVIDYLQLMNAGGKARDNRQQEISEISRSLKILARELDVPVIVLSQLSRAVEQRAGHRPVLSDLRESGAIEQDADIVLFIHREDMYKELAEKAESTGSAVVNEIIIAKHRNGSLGEVPVRWVGDFVTYMNTAKDANEASLMSTEPADSKKPSSHVSMPEPEPFEDIPLPDIVPITESNITDIF